MSLDKRLQFLARVADRATIGPRDSRKWFEPKEAASQALFWLERERLIFPIGQGRYAIPGKDGLHQALTGKDSIERLASWLPDWLRKEENRPLLPSGLEWTAANFIELRLSRETDLVWRGPRLLVPISEGATHLGRINHRVPVIAYDAVHPSEVVKLSNGIRALMPSRREVARLLSVHSDPRLQEAANSIELSEKTWADLRPLISKTDPPMPFPDPKAKLPLGPPFRYRTYAPLRWIRRNLEYSHPSRGKPRGGE